MSRNYLSKNNELRKGDYLMSNNGEWKAVFQDDGNFVIYGWKPVWASDTYGSDVFRLCMQADCNLVMYNKCNEPKWHTNTYISGEANMCRLQLTDDGKLLVFKEGEELWSSATSKGTR
ncbi:mannose-specific lectin-like [Siniperca chuatsi]|uniref:mannose-specific lectin-like n=1 Tax=Siniperca chuatsi TaxID=119488 RepID=UPI001CE102A3|nr:mannose-specific lectin-like [Siniperca chuatsi]